MYSIAKVDEFNYSVVHMLLELIRNKDLQEECLLDSCFPLLICFLPNLKALSL
jgi:hypothetical protein